MKKKKKAKELFYKMVKDNGSDPYSLLTHMPKVEKWTEFLISKHPEADNETTLLGMWLHDIGHYPILREDHAVTGELNAKKFLQKQNLDGEKIEKVIKCVRRHRNKDISPESIEEKIIAFFFFFSHMTDIMYIDMFTQ